MRVYRLVCGCPKGQGIFTAQCCEIPYYVPRHLSMALINGRWEKFPCGGWGHSSSRFGFLEHQFRRFLLSRPRNRYGRFQAVDYEAYREFLDIVVLRVYDVERTDTTFVGRQQVLFDIECATQMWEGKLKEYLRVHPPLLDNVHIRQYPSLHQAA